LVAEDGLFPQPRLDRGDRGFDGRPLFLGSPDRHDHDVDRRDPWGQDEAALIAVDHDHCAERPPREPPRRPKRVPPLVVAIEEADVERPREVRAEVVAGAHLQCPPIAHQRLAGQRHLGAWELLGFALAAPDRRDREPVLPDLRDTSSIRSASSWASAAVAWNV
jgi:hypothetical protein